MNQGFVVSAVVMSFRSQVHLLKEGFNNRRVCAPKANLFPPAVQAGLRKDIISIYTSHFNKLAAQLQESPVCLNAKLLRRKPNFTLLFRFLVAHL